MTNCTGQTPVSDDLLDLVLKIIKGKKLTPGMTGIKKGLKPSELIFITSQGEVPCQIVEDSTFIYFNLPSGKHLALPKEEVSVNT